MYRLEYFERFSVRGNEVYYICNDSDKRVAYKSGVYPRVEVNHDLKEIVFYQIYTRERDMKLNDILFRLTEETLMLAYEDYKINPIRTQCNNVYFEWKEN